MQKQRRVQAPCDQKLASTWLTKPTHCTCEPCKVCVLTSVLQVQLELCEECYHPTPGNISKRRLLEGIRHFQVRKRDDR